MRVVRLIAMWGSFQYQATELSPGPSSADALQAAKCLLQPAARNGKIAAVGSTMQARTDEGPAPHAWCPPVPKKGSGEEEGNMDEEQH
jgi:hypothetical protein